MRGFGSPTASFAGLETPDAGIDDGPPLASGDFPGCRDDPAAMMGRCDEVRSSSSTLLLISTPPRIPYPVVPPQYRTQHLPFRTIMTSHAGTDMLTTDPRPVETSIGGMNGKRKRAKYTARAWCVPTRTRSPSGDIEA